MSEFVVPLEDAGRFALDPPAYVKEHVSKLQAENAELRELVRDMYPAWAGWEQRDDVRVRVEGALRELGIEVELWPLTCSGL